MKNLDLVGLKERFTPLVRLAILNLSDEHFNHISPSLARAAAEIGSVNIFKTCVMRGVDVNAFDGLPLYASVYNGNCK